MAPLKESVRSFPPFMKLLTVAFVALASFALFMFIGMIAGMGLFGVSINEYNQAMQQPGQFPGYMKFMQAIYSVGIFIVPAFMLGYLFYSGPQDKLGLHTGKSPHISTVFLSLLLIVAAMPFINITAEFNASMHLPESMSGIERWMRNMENEAMGITKKLLSGATYQALFVNLIVVALIPAVGEEFLFRGVIQRVFFQMTRSPHAAVWLAAGLFSLLHFQFFGFLPRLFLGVMFGYMLVWSKTIWIPVIAHFANNALAVIFYFFQARGTVGGDLESIGTREFTLVYFLGSAAILAFVLAAIYRNEQMLRNLPYRHQ